jgi:hypothetical protein
VVKVKKLWQGRKSEKGVRRILTHNWKPAERKMITMGRG